MLSIKLAYPVIQFDRVVYMQHLLRVIPVIGILSNKKDFHPSPNADEVEAVFDAPLEMFLKVFSQLVVSLVHIIFSYCSCYNT